MHTNALHVQKLCSQRKRNEHLYILAFVDIKYKAIFRTVTCGFSGSVISPVFHFFFF